MIVIEEHIEGRILSDILDRCHTFDENIARKYILQLCDVLRYLHKQNPPIIHRDIKPENIIITNDGDLELIDFDNSRTFDENKNTDKDTHIIGTLGYAAHEQYGFSQSDIRIDIYSTGVLMHQMLTGGLPNETIYNGKYKRVVKKCLSMDRNKRYKNCTKLSQDIHLPQVIKAIPGFRTGTWWKITGQLVKFCVN